MNQYESALRKAAIANIDDLRALAWRKLPRAVFDYLDGGSEGEVTLQANRTVFDSITFRPRHAVSMEAPNLTTSLLGETLSLPILLAPIGHSSMFSPHGELAAARAAGKANTVYTLATLSGESIEDVRRASGGPLWYQLYLWGGRSAAEGAIQRLGRADFSGLVVTIDNVVNGKRERDIRNGAEYLWNRNPFSSVSLLAQMAMRPRWSVRHFRNGGMPTLPNVIVPGRGLLRRAPYQPVTWQDLDWIRQLWKGPMLIKGVTTSDDAKRALDKGADALIVSNHGGRQLDGVPSSLVSLAEVAASVGDKTELLMDGGIRRGSDVVKAICLGAKAVLCGRAFAYGLVAGESGVTLALSVLRDDVERTLRLLGCSSIDALDRSYLNSKSLDIL